MKYHVYAKSHIGLVRSNNEDNFLVGDYYRKNPDEGIFSYEYYFDCTKTEVISVFDGIAGTQSGEKASRIAAKCLDIYVKNIEKYNEIFDGEHIVRKINRYVCEFAEKTSCDTGSTLAMLVYHDGYVTSYNVGDSRTYIFRDGLLEQLSYDHTQESFLLKIREQYGLDYFKSDYDSGNVLTQYLGIDESEFILEPYVTQNIKINSRDLFLLCSDGLTSHVDDVEITKILAENCSVKDKVDILIDKALQEGASDNITVVLIGE